MRTATSALPVGPYDWHEEVIPREPDYADRLASVRAAMERAAVAALIVHGTTLDDAALVWLTGLTPKLGPAYALVPTAGPLRLLFSGGPGMQPSAARLTWIDDVRALRHTSQNLAAWLDEIAPARAIDIGLWDGTSLSEEQRHAIDAAVAPRGTVHEIGTGFDALRRTKTTRERGLIGQAAAIANTVLAAVRAAVATGATIRAAALAGERAGYAQGAQDIRVLAAPGPDGRPVLLDDAGGTRPASANVYVAVRVAGYWAELVGNTGEPTVLSRAAEAALSSVLSRLRLGATAADVADAAGTIDMTVTGIGTGPAESPDLTAGDVLGPGDVCSVVAAARAGERVGLASAMVAIGADGAAVLPGCPGEAP